MTLEVWTARIGWTGEGALDITRKSADLAKRRGQPFPGEPWAPSWAILGPALEARRYAARREAVGDIRGAVEIERQAWERYEPAFVAEMRVSYRTRRAEWEALLARETVTLLCFCPNHARCHRRLTAEILGKLGARVMWER